MKGVFFDKEVRLNNLQGGLKTVSFETKQTKNLQNLPDSNLGGAFVPYDWTDTKQAPNLGYVAPEDRTTALTNNDRLPLVGRAPTKPLWTEKWVAEGNKQIRYETEFASPTSQIEMFQLFNPLYAKPPPASAHTVPISYKTSRTGIAPTFEGHLRQVRR